MGSLESGESKGIKVRRIEVDSDEVATVLESDGARRPAAGEGIEDHRGDGVGVAFTARSPSGRTNGVT